MALQAYSLARDGSTALSPHFCVREFRCKDGSDPVFVDTALVELLEQLRAHFGKAVTDTKLEELTREVREHNNFARRVPILEEQMKVANHRIADLEKERN